MSNALAADHDASPDTSPTALAAPQADFIPTRQQVRYLQVYLEADGTESRTELAKRAHVNRASVWEWLRNPRFVDWFKSHLDRLLLHDYQLAIQTALRLARMGSAEHLKLIMIKMGDLRHGNANGFDDPSGDGRRQLTVHINVPPARQLSPAEALDTTFTTHHE